MGAHVFDQAIALNPEGEGRYTGATSPAYANMIGPFGGITAATVLNGVLQHPALLGEPLSLTVNYAAALADGAFELSAQPVRTNRSTQHWVMTVTQPDAAGLPQVVVTASAVTAARRETWSVDDEPMPAVPAPDDVAPYDVPSPVEWVRRYVMRPIDGAIPKQWDGSGSHSQSRLWLRDAPARPLDMCGLAAQADIFFPRVWLRRATHVPAGTVSMTVYFHAGAAQLAECGTGWVLGQARAQAFRNGFFDQTALLWSEGGHLLCSTHQVVYFKA
ncbi:MAG: thioesterase family protein [Burkholderiaceae bacterium]